MEENLDINNEINKEISDKTTKSNSEEINEQKSERDIRDTQPTISVNYRVVKNTSENNLEKERNYSNPDNKDDWDNYDDDW